MRPRKMLVCLTASSKRDRTASFFKTMVTLSKKELSSWGTNGLTTQNCFKEDWTAASQDGVIGIINRKNFGFSRKKAYP